MTNASALGHSEAETEASRGCTLGAITLGVQAGGCQEDSSRLSAASKVGQMMRNYEQLHEPMVLAEKPDGNSKSFSPSNQMLAPFTKCFLPYGIHPQ